MLSSFGACLPCLLDAQRYSMLLTRGTTKRRAAAHCLSPRPGTMGECKQPSYLLYIHTHTHTHGHSLAFLLRLVLFIAFWFTPNCLRRRPGSQRRRKKEALKGGWLPGLLSALSMIQCDNQVMYAYIYIYMCVCVCVCV